MASANAPHEILIVAAETSSCLYAQRLLEHWQSSHQKLNAFGIGNAKMSDLGFHCIGRAEEMAVVGFQEVLAHYSDIKAVFNNILIEAEKRKPKVALLLDYPGFNLRLAPKLKALGIHVIYYISPQVWAWKKGRVKDIKKYVDEMLVLFPFEVDFYKKHEVQAQFVGHPILDEIDEKYFSEEYIRERRQRYGIGDHEKLLALMPGSRNSEMGHHLETQLKTAEELLKKNPGVKVALFLAPDFNYEEFQSRLPRTSFPLTIVQGEPLDMICMADLVLCASGTATLMVGLLAKPMVVMYRMNPLTAWLAKLIVRSTPFFGMINLVLGREVVPEHFQGEATPEKLSHSLDRFLQSEEDYNKVVEELGTARSLLKQGGATAQVSERVFANLQKDEPA